MLAPYDIVTVNGDCPAEEIRGKTGYIISAVLENEDIGVFIYDEGLVWCIAQRDVTATGRCDGDARDYRCAAIRVNSKGEILD